MFDPYFDKALIGFRTHGVGSGIGVFFHIEFDADILSRLMIKFLMQ